ncbi:MAG TPA: extracellular solute-binding protein [Polyangiaceae bacterium]|jgi:multiple sugar transport system permease protein|nr:extracellular solute-binding protein [Polyangiaceae bacterium]
MKRLSLRAAVALFVLFVCSVSYWTFRSSAESTDGREDIVLWAGWMLGDDIYGAIDRFEKLHPQYHVIATTGTAQDATGDAQRLLSAVAGGVPPDVVFFDRFAIGEWASKHALEDLTPYIERQDPADAHRIELRDYYPWSVEEASYRPPGSSEPRRLYGIPTVADARLLYANLDLLRQEGLTDDRGEPRLPKTWDDLREYAKRLSRYRIAGRPDSGLVRLGFAPNFGNSFLYMFAFEAGGGLLSADGLRATMDSPPVVRALRFMTDVYDDLGGAEQVNAFQESFQAGPLDPFLKGQVAMKIDGNWYLENTLGDWKPDMNFALAPAPMPADELAKGRSPVTWASGWAFVVPTTSHHKEAAFELIRYFRTWEVVDRLDQSKRERKQNEGRLYLPAVDANRRFTERVFQQNIFRNSAVPATFKQGYQTLAALLEEPLIRPVSPVGQLLWRQQIRASDAAVGHKYALEAKTSGKDEVAIALERMQEPVQRQLDELVRPLPKHVVGWIPYLGAYVASIVTLLGAVVYTSHRRRRSHSYKMRETGAALLFASPWIIGFAVLTGGPILCSIVLSFTRYDILTEARYVGLSNFKDVFADPVFYKSLLNTAFMVLRIPLIMAVGLVMALLLNSGVRGIGVYRTGLYLPVTMPIVASCLLWIWIFNSRTSFLNEGFRFCFDTVPARAFEWVVNRFTSQPFRLDAPLWLQDPRFSKLALVVMNVWAAGGGMVIWLAGLQSIPKQLYEAANIDGAGAIRRFWHITLPMLSPYILFNSIVGLIGTMQIFTEAYIMTAGGPLDSTLFYAYYLFRQAFQFFRMGYASALAWILFAAVLALTVIQLRLSKRWVHYDHT